jgi:uracil phosphoribosyltransferase
MVLSPAQIVLLPEIFATGGTETETTMLVVSMHPAALVATTVYVAAEEGETVIEAAVDPVFQE